MDYKEIEKEIIISAKKKGIEEIEVLLVKEDNKEITVRNGKVDILNESISVDSRIKLIKNKRIGLISLNNFNMDKINKAIANSSEYLNIQREDPDNRIPPESELGSVDGELFIDEEKETPDNSLIEKKLIEMEKAAIRFDNKVKYSEGASFHYAKTNIHFANSRGFYGYFSKTYNSLYISVVAEKNNKRKSGEYWSENVFFTGLENEKFLGKLAAKRALKKLDSKKPKTGEYPVIFDNITASSILEVFGDLLNGESIYKKSSVLAGKVGKSIGSSILNIKDNPLIKKLLGSRPFDGDGVYSREKNIVEDGVLKSFLVNYYYSKKLKHRITSNASFNTEVLNDIKPTNFYISPGKIGEEDLIASLKKGIYITNIFSIDSLNHVTGDFSWGAEGFLIDKGKLSTPISEFTIAGNILDLFGNIREICDNIDFNRGQIASPSFLVYKGITIGGK